MAAINITGRTGPRCKPSSSCLPRPSRVSNKVMLLSIRRLRGTAVADGENTWIEEKNKIIQYRNRLQQYFLGVTDFFRRFLLIVFIQSTSHCSAHFVYHTLHIVENLVALSFSHQSHFAVNWKHSPSVSLLLTMLTIQTAHDFVRKLFLQPVIIIFYVFFNS